MNRTEQVIELLNLKLNRAIYGLFQIWKLMNLKFFPNLGIYNLANTIFYFTYRNIDSSVNEIKEYDCTK